MSKSEYPRWFNPTGDSIWDKYYEVFWCGVLGLIMLIVLLVIGAMV